MTLTEIRQELYAQIDNNSTLSDLTPSTMAVLKAIADCVSFVIYLFYADQTQFIADIDEVINDQKVGSIEWYNSQAKLFQYGDEVVVDDNYQVGYAVANEDVQIVEFACVREVIESDVMKLKVQVSKANKEVLDSSELQAFTAYMNKVKFAGIHLIVESLTANVLELNVQVSVNAEVIDSTGESLTESGVYPVQDAINAYVDSLEYGGYFNRNACIDAVQAVSGVNDVVISSVSVDGATRTEQNILAENGAFSLDSLTDTYTNGRL